VTNPNFSFVWRNARKLNDAAITFPMILAGLSARISFTSPESNLI